MDAITTERLDLVLLTAERIEAVLADGNAERTIAGLLVPAGWPDEHDANFLRLRLGQIRARPADEVWLARAIVLRGDETRPMIGHIGFHNPPKDGALELGYTVFEAWRRQGVASEAALGMMRWAREAHGVRRFVVSISPENAPSLAMAERLGFERTGEHMDEEDGLEYVFELVVE